MADINEKLNQTEQVTKSIEKTLENIVKLETEINTKTSRITPELIGEEHAEEKERTITQLKQAVKEYKEELNSIKSVEVNSNTADALAGRVDRLNEKMEVTKKTIKEIYEMAANTVVGHFDTSSGKGIKADLNNSVSRLGAFVDNPEYQKKIEKALDVSGLTEMKKAYEDAKGNKELTEAFSAKYTDKVVKEMQKNFTEQINKSFSKEELSLAKINFANEAKTLYESINVNTLGLAINNALESKGAKIAEAIYKNDLLEGQMGAFTKSGARERTLESNPEGLLFGTGYDLSEMQERIDQAKQNLAEQFPEGRNTPPIEEFGQTIEDVQKEYDKQVKEIEKLTNEMLSLSKQINASGGYLAMYENAKSANASLAIPNTINDRLFELGQGNTIGNIIHDEYSQKVRPTNTEITAKTIEDKVVEGYKNALNSIASLESMQNIPVLQEVLGDEYRSKLAESIANINKQYNEMRENIKNTPIEIKSTGASFDAAQIEQYKNGLDELIVEGNKLRELMVYNFNQVNSSEISGIDDISVKWQDFVNKATSEKRLKITDDESVDKMMLIDNIMKDIQRQASEFDILPNAEAKIQHTLLGSAQFIREQRDFFGNSDKQFIVNDVEIQKLQIALDLLKQLRENTSNVRSEDYSPEKTKTIDKITENIIDRINKLKEANEKITEKAKELGIKIEDAPQVKYSNRIGTAFNEFVGRYSNKNKEYETYLHSENISQANEKKDEEYKKRALEAEEKRHTKAMKDIADEAEAYRSIFRIADSDYRGKRADEAKAQAEAEKQAAKDAAQAAREQAKAQADAAKAQADAQKQWESQVNNLRNKVSEVTNYIKQAVANTVKVIRAANNVVNKSISVMIGAFDKLGSAVQRIIQLFGNFGNRVTGFNKQGNILKGTFTELKSKVDLLVGAFNKLYNNSFINEGKKLLSSVQTLNMLIGTELTTQTMEWATNLEHAFGLSAAGLIADLKELTAVMYGLGMSAGDVQVAATNLEAVAMSLSATTGYDFSTVVNKIQSGMKGMTQSIDDLGLSVRESQMDAFLKKLKAQGGEYANIGTSFSQLEEQQRIYVRYAAIMDQFTSKDAYSAENYAKSLRTITGSLSILNSQLRGLKSDIGSLALQLFAKIIQPLIYIIYLVRQAVAGLANLLGIDITLNPKINNSEDVVAPIEDVTDALDKEADAADKAKGSLDSLDHVSTMSESKNSKKGDKFDYSSLMNISDDYAKLLEDLGKMQNDFIEECKEKFWAMVNDIKDRFTAWIKRITGRLIDWDAIKANWELIKENLQKTWDNIVRIFKAGTDIIGGLLYSIFDDLDGTTLLAKLSDIIERFTRLIALILERVQPKIQAFYDKYVSKYVIKAGEKIKQVLNDIIAKLDEFIAWWENPGSNEAINKWFENLGKHFEELMTIFKVLFNGDKDFIGDDYDIIKNMGPGMKSVYDLALSLHNIFGSLKDIIADVAKSFLDFNNDNELTKDDAKIGIQKALDKVSEKLKEFEKWLDDNKDNISALLREIIETVGALAEAKFTIVKDLIKYVVENASTITAILDALQEVIKWIAEHPTLAIGISIAGQTVAGLGKTAISAAIWKKILGLGAKGAASTAAAEGGVTIGAKLLTGVKGAFNTSQWAGLFGSTSIISGEAKAGIIALGSKIAGILGIVIFEGLTAFTSYEGAKEGFNMIIDGLADVEGIVNTVDKKTGKAVKITAENTKTYAYEIRKALVNTFGKDVDISKAQQAFRMYAEDLQKTYNLTDEETEYIVRNIERQYNRIGDSLDGVGATIAYSSANSENNIKLLENAFQNMDGTAEETTKSVSEDFSSMSTNVSDSVNAAKKPMDDLSYKCQQVRYSLKYTLRSLAEEITKIAANLSSRIGTLFSQVGVVARQTESLRQASQRTVQQSSGWNPVKLKGFASGGVPSTGSIFMANENGNAELVGNFGGYTGVANQDMIIKAMQNAMVQAIKSAGGFGQSGSVVNNYNIGTMIGDDSSYRQLARKLNTINERSNSNIANVGFVMS